MNHLFGDETYSMRERMQVQEKVVSFSHLVILFRHTPSSEQRAKQSESELEFAGQSSFIEMSQTLRASQFPGTSPMTSALHYILATHPSVFTRHFCAFSFHVFRRGAIRNCYVRSVCLVCRRNIPHIILSLNVSGCAPIAIDLPRL